jgi:uncharacterized RDD family membrane protein YckC
MGTMVADMERLAQVFLWKEGDAPDLDYARELLRVVNPDAYKAVEGDTPPLQIIGVVEPWPDDPWVRAVEDMDSIPAPTGTRWTDPANYDLAGWQGKDLRTEENLFVVTAYRRPTQATEAEATDVEDDIQPLAHTPYQPQYPTGPIAWPPASSVRGAGESPLPGTASAYYPSRHNPLQTGPLESGQPSDNIPEPWVAAIQATLFDSYAPFYVGFGPRLVAMLIDLFFTTLFPLIGVIAVAVRGPSRAGTLDIGQYALVACLGLLLFMAYHVVQIGLWGQTLGKVLMGIKVVAPDGGPPGYGRAMLRVLGYGFSFLLAGWGFLMIALDPRRQALHDRIAETVVIPEHLDLQVPRWLPGYRSAATPRNLRLDPALQQAPSAVGMAAVAGVQEYDKALLSTVPQLSEIPSQERPSQSYPPPQDLGLAAVTTGPLAVVDAHSIRLGPGSRPNVEKARALFKSALTQLEEGSTPGVRGYKVEPEAARVAASLFKDALDLVPNSVVYHYFYAVALRYSEGIEAALREFKLVLELDPGHYEAQQQMTYGARWHDAFAYPSWLSPAPVEVGRPIPQAITDLLPEGTDPVTRMVLLREGGNKRAAFLSRTPLSAWPTPPSLHMQASLHLLLSRTPHGPILAVYVIMDEGVHHPYIGEAFLNPREAIQNAEDACQLGQHILEQLARQDRTYFIFADENNRLLLSRKVAFNTNTQVSIARILYEVQTLPSQTLEPERFVEAARWHMEHISLEQVKEQLLSDSDQ